MRIMNRIETIFSANNVIDYVHFYIQISEVQWLISVYLLRLMIPSALV